MVRSGAERGEEGVRIPQATMALRERGSEGQGGQACANDLAGTAATSVGGGAVHAKEGGNRASTDMHSLKGSVEHALQRRRQQQQQQQQVEQMVEMPSLQHPGEQESISAPVLAAPTAAVSAEGAAEGIRGGGKSFRQLLSEAVEMDVCKVPFDWSNLVELHRSDLGGSSNQADVDAADVDKAVEVRMTLDFHCSLQNMQSAGCLMLKC